MESQGRIQNFPQEGAPIPGGGRLPNILVIFSEKPYEIKEILVRRGGRAPPKSATESNRKRFHLSIHSTDIFWSPSLFYSYFT